jgi:gas vesicle protein
MEAQRITPRDAPREVGHMKFVTGLLIGVVAGAVGAVVYSAKSGRDLRETYEMVRSDLTSSDLDALGARLELRFSELQARLEQRIGEVRERAAAAMEHAGDAAADAAEDAGQAAEDAAEDAGQAAEDQAGA